MNANSLLAKTSTGSNLISYPRLTPSPSCPRLAPTPPPHSTSIFASSSRRFLNIENASPPLVSPYLLRSVPSSHCFSFYLRHISRDHRANCVVLKSDAPCCSPPSPHRRPRRGSGNLTVRCIFFFFFLCTVSHWHMTRHVRVYVVERKCASVGRLCVCGLNVCVCEPLEEAARIAPMLQALSRE